MGQTLSAILPLLAIVLAGGVIAVLWYWWSSGQEERGEQQRAAVERAPEQKAEHPPAGVIATIQSWVSRIAGSISVSTGGAAPSGVQTARTAPALATNGELVEVLRAFRDLADGGLVIEIGGRRYKSLADMTDPQVRRRFVGNAQALAQFAGEGESSPLVTWATPVPEMPELPPLPPQPVMAPPTPTSPATADAKKEPQPPAPKTMADEIEELIQLRLSLTPALVNRSIHIQPDERGGIRVEVDGNYFDSVGDVPDPEVLAFLQSVIREWEAHQ